MSKIGIMENGVKRSRRRRRNPSPVVKASTKNPTRRRSISLVSAKAVLKKNGMKAISSRVMANPKRRKHHKRRNGLQTITARRSNGLLGKSRNDAKQVGTILGGAMVTKLISRFISPFVSPYLASTVLGQYVDLIVDGVTALLVVPFIAGKFMKGGETEKNARIGGLLVVGLDAIGHFAPSALQLNPFITAPLAMGSGGAAIPAATVAQIAQGVANSNNPQQAAAQVAGVMGRVNGFNSGYTGGNYTSREPMTVL